MYSNSLRLLLQKRFALDSFRKGQADIIQNVIQRKDVLAVLPTGGGKSLCYQLPAVYLNQLVVVVSPLIALMKDQVQSLTVKGIPAGFLFAEQHPEERKAVFDRLKKGGAFVLYMSPERIQKRGFKEWIATQKLALFAIDEAHCVSQWGHDFREEYGKLNVLKQYRPDVPILALTASATPLVLDDISEQLRLEDPAKSIHGFYRPNLYFQVQPCEDDVEKMSYLTAGLRQFPDGKKIIYCGTRKQTEEVALFLKKSFEKVGYYHAGLPTAERVKMQEEYIAGDIDILVATNAFGMGIDQPNVRMVCHYQLPGNIDSLYQEMGRAGRDGKDATCMLLYAKADRALQNFFIESSRAPGPIKANKRLTLEALIQYCEAEECRHSEILTYFKDSNRIDRCGHCDVCVPDSPRRIRADLSQISDENAPKISKVKAGRGMSRFMQPRKPSRRMRTADDIMSLDEQKRFEALKNWRKQIAMENDLPAFVIIGDKTLKELAKKNPKAVDDMKDVTGFDEGKVEKYGENIIQFLDQANKMNS